MEFSAKPINISTYPGSSKNDLMLVMKGLSAIYGRTRRVCFPAAGGTTKEAMGSLQSPVGGSRAWPTKTDASFV